MPTSEELFSALPDLELAQHFRNANVALDEEAAVLDIIIRNVLAAEGRVSNKSIIISLVKALESTRDEAQAEVLRKTLEIVVGYTPDD
ncbi:biofilm development regulator YmgB/AriR family protein [Candidatus Pantoea multigeneris]|uniref:Two-component-system connector protein AriR n=1 Tax=Candidatus Pantoea multigeneris TaxID=2608357 RepID=A0ABX0RGM0_9GAMM|nr:biofilm development regulator YmgB/AriR family protein [Pantoea multigeneris]NIF23944.1 two-component-system connector protein AriR [Pantoea multigeneris]